MKFLPGLVIFCCCLNSFNTAVGDAPGKTEEKSSHEMDKEIVLADLPQDCHQPKEVGRCFGLFHRYAFNTEKLACEEFIYGGCMGNKNNFKTLADCERVCLKKEDVANSELDVELDVPGSDQTKAEDHNKRIY